MSSADELRALVTYLAPGPANEHHWNGWRIVPVRGGANNRVYRAERADNAVAVKFAIRDERDRAGREHAALRYLAQLGLAIAPRALLLDRDSFGEPVVVMSWLKGRACAAPPANAAGWAGLMGCYATLHSATRDQLPVDMPPMVLGAWHESEARELVHAEVARLPKAAQPPVLARLLTRMEARPPAVWPRPTAALCRNDANLANFLPSAERWRAVDWEYAGRGDPAFELAELMVQPSFAAVPTQCWTSALDAYVAAGGAGDDTARAIVYRRCLLVWWVARFARYLFEVPRGGDARLAERPADWQQRTETQLYHYVELCERELLGHT